MFVVYRRGGICNDPLGRTCDGHPLKREGRCDEIVRHDRVVERTLRQPVHVRVLLILERELTVRDVRIQVWLLT